MSWSEIAGMYEEINGIKKAIKDQFGITVRGGTVRDTDKELDDLRNALQAYLKNHDTLSKRIEDMSLDLARLTEEVTRAQTVQTSAVTLLTNLTTELAKVSAELQAKGEMVPPVVDVAPLNALIDRLKDSTDVLAGAVADSTGVVQHHEVILNADDATTPTVAVVMPEVLPENVVISAETIVETVDPASTEPQIVVTVEPAPAPVEVAPEAVVEPTVSGEIVTEEGQVNVQIEAPAVVVEDIKAETGIDIVEAVKEAFEAAPEVVAEVAPEAPAAEVAPEVAPEVVAEAPAAEVAPEAPVAEEAPKTE